MGPRSYRPRSQGRILRRVASLCSICVAFAGDDRNALALKTAGQIQQLDSLSASQLFVKGAQKGIEGAENVAEGTKDLAETVKDAVTK